MTMLAFILVFVLPLLAFLAFARTLDGEPPWRRREAIILHLAILCVAVIVLTFIDLYLF